MDRDTRFIALPPRDQASLYGASLREAVAEAPEVLALDAALTQLDFSTLEAQYSETGHPAYHPRILAGLLLYGYSLGVRSSRALESMCRLHAGFRFLTHGLVPDHNTICRFRAEQVEALRELFRESVRLCQEAGLVSLETVAIDGTKVRANRSRQALAQAEAAFAEAMTETVEAERQECALMKAREGIQPAYNAQVAVDSAQQVIVACAVTAAPTDYGQLEPMAAAVHATCGAAPQQVLADAGYYQQEQIAHLEAQGVAVYLPLPTPPRAPVVWDETAQGYRCPAGHLLTRYRERKGKIIYRYAGCRGCPQRAACGVQGSSKEVHVAPGSHQSRAALFARMGSAAGRAVYAARRSLVEPIFAWRKHNAGFRRFSLRGQRRAEGEWCLLCAGHNLQQWWRHGWAWVVAAPPYPCPLLWATA